MAAGSTNYLVGIDFRAYGNLAEKMGVLGGLFDILRNKYFDFATAGVAVFSELTDQAIQYQNTLLKINAITGNMVQAHKVMKGILTPGGAQTGIPLATREALAAQTLRVMKEESPTLGRAEDWSMRYLRYQAGVPTQTAQSTIADMILTLRNAGLARGMIVGSPQMNQFMGQTLRNFAVNLPREAMPQQFETILKGLLTNPVFNRYSPQALVNTASILGQTPQGEKAYSAMQQVVMGFNKNASLFTILSGMGVPMRVTGNLLTALHGHAIQTSEQFRRLLVTHTRLFTQRILLPFAEQQVGGIAPGTPYARLTSAQAAEVQRYARRALGDFAPFITMLGAPHLRAIGWRSVHNRATTDEFWHNIEANLNIIAKNTGKAFLPIAQPAGQFLSNAIGALAGVSGGGTGWKGTGAGLITFLASFFASKTISGIGKLVGMIPWLNDVGYVIRSIGVLGGIVGAAMAGWEIGKALDKIPAVQKAAHDVLFPFFNFIFKTIPDWISLLATGPVGMAITQLSTLGKIFNTTTVPPSSRLSEYVPNPYYHAPGVVHHHHTTNHVTIKANGSSARDIHKAVIRGLNSTPKGENSVYTPSPITGGH